MSEENKAGQPAPSNEPEQNKAVSPAAPGAAGPGSEPKPKAPPAKKPVKKVPSYEDLTDDPLLAELQRRFPGAVVSGQSFLEQRIFTVALERLTEVMIFLRESLDWGFTYLVDLTALDYVGDPKRFCLVYHLYSAKTGRLIRIKSRAAQDEMVPSVAGIWQTADWLEREVYDMFGIEFAGHPDLRRILLPDDWIGYPLRKDYDIKLQDQAWIRKHLRIRKIPE